jgi:hypothetical protein
MAVMNLAELEKQLHGEGFTGTYVWEDGPDCFYSEHSHALKPRTSS